MNSDPHDKHGGRPIRPGSRRRPAPPGLIWSKCEPPDLLDQAVLNAARRQLERSRRRRSMGWLGAFATAAVVVLALTIVVRQDLPGPVHTRAGDRWIPPGPRRRRTEGSEQEEPKIMQDEPAAPLEQAKRMSSAAPAASEAARLLREERQAGAPETRNARSGCRGNPGSGGLDRANAEAARGRAPR